MSWIDWLIVIVPVVFVLWVGFYSRKYIRGVADFLAAGRICGRYVICVGDVANALSIIGVVAYVEVHYKTGFALAFWQLLTGPLGVFMGLIGFVTYRFRETKALSLGQFLEMRYNRPFRIFAAVLRSISEMLANMIMPAVAARFFIYLFDLPQTFSVFGFTASTFSTIILICLALAISIICMGGTLSLIITDAIQGMLSFPLIVTFVIFILCKFSWSQEIVPVLSDRAAGESFLNPYDLSKLRDFNLFFVVVVIFSAIMHRASWIGAGTSTAAKTPHEQKMAGLLGTWRGSTSMIFYIMIAVAIITLMNHQNWAPAAKQVRDRMAVKIAGELIPDDAQRQAFNAGITAVPEQIHRIGVDKPLSQDVNLDTPLLNKAHQTLQAIEIANAERNAVSAADKADAKSTGEARGNAKFQQFHTLFHQMMLGQSMREMLPTGLLGLFALLMVLAMISTDDTRIYSATITLTQDVIMPLRKKPFTPEQHVRVLRLVAVGVGVFFFFGSKYMAQLDYINLFTTLVCTMWLGGCGPVMMFGLYSRFGTTAGAFTSLITGMVISLGGIFVQRNWAEMVYPWLAAMEWVEPMGQFLSWVSSPLNPYVIWEMNPMKFPINSYELYFITMLVTLSLYCLVSFLTMKEPFNLDRMLHRGIYNLDGDKKETLTWSPRTFFSKLLGITGEHTPADKFIAWAFFFYGFVYNFILTFIVVAVWNIFSPWPLAWWGHYSLVVYLLVPGIMAAIATFWFGIGGFVDLLRLFRDLEKRLDDPLDDGWVEGNVSAADRDKFQAVEQAVKKSQADQSGR